MAARLSYLDRDQLTPELQEVYDTLRQASGRVLNIYRLMAHHAGSLPGSCAGTRRCARGRSTSACYLAYVRASQLNRCGYCVTHNTAAGLRVGVAREKLEALAAWEASPLFSDLERLVLRYAEAMTRDVQVKADLVEALKAQLSPEALVQLTLSIAAANFTNRFNEALGTELEGRAPA